MDHQEKDNAGVIGPPPLIAFGPLLIGLLLHRVRPRTLLPRAVARPLGLILLVGGITGSVWTFLTFQRQETPIDPREPVNHLITTGPFQYSRNPSYSTFIAIYLGITGLVNSAWPLLLLPLSVMGLIRGVIEREERYLEARFGDEYLRYLEEVGRWW